VTAHLLFALLVSVLQVITPVDSKATGKNQHTLYLLEGRGLPENINYAFRNNDWALTFDYCNKTDAISVFELMPDKPGDYYILRIKSVDNLMPLSGIIPYVTTNDVAIFKSNPDQAQILSCYGWGLTKILPQIRTSKTYQRVAAPTIANVDSNIVRMISDITPQTTHQLIADLSSIYSRYSLVQGCREAEQYAFDRFNEHNLATSFFNFQYSDTVMRNVIGQITGRVAPESIIIVCGHVDCTSENRNNIAPGAEDNASGTAAVLEAARVLSNYPTDLTLRFIIFSGEEQGLIGSDDYAQFVQTQGEIIAAVIDVDMVAYSGPYALDMHIFSDPQSYWLGQLATNVVSTYSSLDTISHYEYSPRWGSDHYPFAIRGYPAIFFIDAWDGFDWYPFYHTTADTLGNLNLNQEASICGSVAALAATLARPYFSPSYLPGDANGSGNVNGIDVVFLVNYFKGGRAPDPVLRGDANGDCRTNGIDVVYLVNFLKGGPIPFSGPCY
jgi:hypothetical protein